ncbi:hypothetical protein GY45DRAFT_71761 [Cubamyces sp. BRFM 1775]|nr:hypothetical protein GY45DRAFT_71761 [Cubamyces sp. BRFM 1775]
MRRVPEENQGLAKVRWKEGGNRERERERDRTTTGSYKLYTRRRKTTGGRVREAEAMTMGGRDERARECQWQSGIYKNEYCRPNIAMCQLRTTMASSKRNGAAPRGGSGMEGLRWRKGGGVVGGRCGRGGGGYGGKYDGERDPNAGG